MTLIPNVPLTSGDEYTEEIANLAFNQVYDDQPQYLGHHLRLSDDSLSNENGNVKPRLNAIENAFKVSVESGLTLRYQSGVVKLPNGQNLAIVSSLVIALDNRTSYVYIDSLGAVVCNEMPSVNRVLLAKVVAVSGQVVVLEDLRHPSFLAIQPLSRAVKVFGGLSEVDKVATQGEVFNQGLYYFRNFTVPAGIAVTVDRQVKIFCSGTVRIEGTVDVSAMGFGAIRQGYILSNLGSTGGLPGSGLGHRGASYPWGSQLWGSGGQQGSLSTLSSNSWGFSWQGGDGGGSLQIEAAGSIVITGTIRANGTAGGRGGTGSPEVQGTTSANVGVISGSGGGSGGLINLSSLTSITATNTAVIEVMGGNGGDGFNNSSSTTAFTAAFAGYGGGGGYLVLASPANNITGSTIRLNGGVPGTAQGNFRSSSNGVFIIDNPVFYLGGGVGGGYGGASSLATTTITNGTTYTITYPSSSEVGKLILLNATPIG